MTSFVAPSPLGVGLTYQPGLRAAMRAADPLIDFYEVSPDILCRERVRDGRRALELHPDLLDEALEWCRGRPVVAHGLGLSIGTASGWNAAYLDLLDRFRAVCDFPWHSEHLGFLQVEGPDGETVHAGVQLPVPFTAEALDLIVPRARAMIERYGKPFALENTTHYLPAGPDADPGRDEVGFLDALARRSGCALVLDLYNLHCNAVNFGFDAAEALSGLDLERVIEIHVAGGAVHDGFLMDVHSDVVPEPVWGLLEWVVPRAPNLAGIVYELLEQAAHVVGVDGVVAQLERARAIWAMRPAALARGGEHVAA